MPLEPLYRLVARGIVVFHNGLAPVFGTNTFLSYALAIVLIVMLVRLLIVPLFVRSVKAQRTMQMLQPHIKEIREKHKNDRQKMNTEIMALQKEHGNPLLGCLPLILQIPLFISLFHVFRAIAPTSDGHGGYFFKASSGLTVQEVTNIAQAKLGGVSLAAAITNPAGELSFLHTNGTAVKITCLILIVVMSLTTFLTQKQIMARNGPADPQQQNIQRILLYASPLMLAVFGFRFPIAVLLYWLTTNLWSMGQQHFIIKKMPPLNVGKGAGAGTPSLTKGAKTPAGGTAIAGDQPARLTQVRTPATGGSAGANGSNGSSTPRQSKPAKAPPGRPVVRSGVKKRGGKGGPRRGGRH